MKTMQQKQIETNINLRTVTSLKNGERYRLPDNETQWRERFEAHIFDAKGSLMHADIESLNEIFKQHGVLHIINTGLDAKQPNDIPMSLLDKIGFGEKDQFAWGGLTSGRTNLKYVSKAMRETDVYPKDKFLLPHNEILYQKFMPERLLFYCARPTERDHGGRTLVHCAKKVEGYIESSGITGQRLLEKMHRHGFTIETGFLDENHPEKDKNYFRSWQDRFSTQTRAQALALCLKSTDQFDDGYWVEEPVKSVKGEACFTLMTRITIPAFKTDERDGETYMLFPRIALDGPHVHNGYRRFLIGDDELTAEETAILLEAFLDTREGRYYESGDILLVDNIRYGHGRESFQGERAVYASMAGMFWVDGAA